MNYKLLPFFLLLIAFNSCKNDTETRIIETKKEAKKMEVIFKNINKGWVFYDTPITAASEASLSSWNELRLFLSELGQKPKKTIGAFRQKSKALTQKALALNNNIPANFNNPPIQSRIATLITKVQMLDLYLHLDKIPDQKVVVLVGEINIQLVSLQRQMDKIVEKAKIPIEEGEADLIKMRDTARAIQNTPQMGKMIPKIQ
jgi:hypothetical protein